MLVVEGDVGSLAEDSLGRAEGPVGPREEPPGEFPWAAALLSEVCSRCSKRGAGPPLLLELGGWVDVLRAAWQAGR